MSQRVAVALGMVLLLAGCSGLSMSPGATPSGTPAPATSGTPAPTATASATPSPGFGEVPYELWIDNTGNGVAYTLTVTFAGPVADHENRTVFNETITVGANTSVNRNITFSRTGTYRVEVHRKQGATISHEYDVRSSDPRTAVVIGIRANGALMVATYHP